MKGPDAEMLATWQNPVLVDMNIFVWINRSAKYASLRFGPSRDLNKQRDLGVFLVV